MAMKRGYTLVDESKLSDQYHRRFLGYFYTEEQAKRWAEKEYKVPPEVWGERVYVTTVGATKDNSWVAY